MVDTIILHAPGDEARAQWLIARLPGRRCICCAVKDAHAPLGFGAHLLRLGVLEKADDAALMAALTGHVRRPAAGALLSWRAGADIGPDALHDVRLIAMPGEEGEDAALADALAAGLNVRADPRVAIESFHYTPAPRVAAPFAPKAAARPPQAPPPSPPAQAVAPPLLPVAPTPPPLAIGGGADDPEEKQSLARTRSVGFFAGSALGVAVVVATLASAWLMREGREAPRAAAPLLSPQASAARPAPAPSPELRGLLPAPAPAPEPKAAPTP